MGGIRAFGQLRSDQICLIDEVFELSEVLYERAVVKFSYLLFWYGAKLPEIYFLQHHHAAFHKAVGLLTFGLTLALKHLFQKQNLVMFGVYSLKVLRLQQPRFYLHQPSVCISLQTYGILMVFDFDFGQSLVFLRVGIN